MASKRIGTGGNLGGADFDPKMKESMDALRKGLDEAAAKQADQMKRFHKGVNALTQTLTGLDFSVVGLMSLTKTAINANDKLQQAFLGVGSNLTKELSKSTQAVNDLGIGTIIPLQERLKFVQDGFTTVTDSNIKVATELAMTGQSTASVRSLLKTALIQGGQAREQGDMFISTMRDTAKSRGVQTEFLAKSMNALAKTMEVPDFMGVGNNLREAMVQLTSEYSLGDKALNRFITAFISSDNLTSRVITGTQHLAAAIGSNTASVPEIKAAILQAASKTDDTATRFERGIKVSGMPFVSGQRALGIFGQDFVMGARGIVNAQKQGINALRISDDFRQSMLGQMKGITGHLEKLTSDLFPLLIRSFNVVAGVGLGAQIMGGVGTFAGGAMSKKLLAQAATKIGPVALAAGILTGGYFAIDALFGTADETGKNTKGTKDAVEELVKIEKDKVEKINTEATFAQKLANARANIQSRMGAVSSPAGANSNQTAKLVNDRFEEILVSIFTELRTANRINKKK
tara:strand:- start:6938 stop:8488 length:1551 start_codon:yes stop_codon:yes gene_type:complete